MTYKIIHLIKLKEKGANVEQAQISEQYRQVLNLVDNIFYSAKILHYYKIQNGFEKLEKETYNIIHDYLQLD